MTNRKDEISPLRQALKIDKDYQSVVKEIQSLLLIGQSTAYKAVDNIKVQTYWQIGERIVREEIKNKDRADYGKYLVDNLTVDLGIARRRLYEFIKFYRHYPIVRALHGQLSWYHYLALITIESENKRKFYENKAVINSWGYRELNKQIKSKLFEKASVKEVEEIFRTKLPTVIPAEIFKDSYDFNFIESASGEGEKELESNLINNVILFLKELGEDFSLIGRQIPIKIDKQTHFIDLVLYHRGIPCIVLVDLKTGKLNSRDVGQMNKYIWYYRRNKQYDHEKDTIGLIICQYAGEEEVVYALDDLEDKIFIAQYKTKLPSENQIRSMLKDFD